MDAYVHYPHSETRCQAMQEGRKADDCEKKSAPLRPMEGEGRRVPPSAMPRVTHRSALWPATMTMLCNDVMTEHASAIYTGTHFCANTCCAAFTSEWGKHKRADMVRTMQPDAEKPRTIALTAKMTVAKCFGFV